jgi:PIN domain nuclease of toxin-antitoxin system
VSYLFDTHLLVWAVGRPAKLTRRISALMENSALDRCFSVVSIWEAVIKHALQKSDFRIDAHVMRVTLLKGGFREIEITSAHALAVRDLPLNHGDPFDRLLVAQAKVESLTLVTADEMLARYPAKVMVM